MRRPHDRFLRWFRWSGLSQVQLARRLGCSQAMVSRIVGGSRHVFSVDMAVAIEREMSRPRADGKVYRGRPVKPGEWLSEPAPRRGREVA